MGSSLLIASPSVSGGVVGRTGRRFGFGNTVGFYNLTTDYYYEVPIRDAGTVRNLYVYISTAPSGATDTWTVDKSRVNTSLTVSYTAGQSGAKEDTSNSASFAATDEISVSWTTTTWTNPGIGAVCSVEFEPDATGDTLTKHTAAADMYFAPSASTTWYALPFGVLYWSSTEAPTQWTARGDFTAQDLSVNVETNGRSTATTVRTRKNAANGGQSISVSSSATGLFEDTSGTDTLTDGDEYNYSVTAGTGTGAFITRTVNSTLISTDGQFVMGGGDNAAVTITANATRYVPVAGGFRSPDATEATTQILPRFDFTAKKLQVYCVANSINANSVVWTLRDNGADSSLAVTFTTGQTGLMEDTSNTATITGATDEIGIKINATHTSGSFTALWYDLLGETATSNAYTLVCDQGSFALTGQSAGLVRSLTLACAAGSFALTGQALTLTRALSLTCLYGSFALTGQDVGTGSALTLACDAGSLSLSGQSCGLWYTGATTATLYVWLRTS